MLAHLLNGNQGYNQLKDGNTCNVNLLSSGIITTAEINAYFLEKEYGKVDPNINVRWVPSPAVVRKTYLEALRYNNISGYAKPPSVAWTIAPFIVLQLGGHACALVGVHWLLREAEALRTYGPTYSSDALEYRYGQMAWLFIGIGYSLTVLRRLMSLALSAYSLSNPVRRLHWLVYPECIGPCIGENIFFGLGEIGVLIFAFVFMTMYDYSTEPDDQDCNPYVLSYALRLLNFKIVPFLSSSEWLRYSIIVQYAGAFWFVGTTCGLLQSWRVLVGLFVLPFYDNNEWTNGKQSKVLETERKKYTADVNKYKQNLRLWRTAAQLSSAKLNPRTLQQAATLPSLSPTSNTQPQPYTFLRDALNDKIVTQNLPTIPTIPPEHAIQLVYSSPGTIAKGEVTQHIQPGFFAITGRLNHNYRGTVRLHYFVALACLNIATEHLHASSFGYQHTRYVWPIYKHEQGGSPMYANHTMSARGHAEYRAVNPDTSLSMPPKGLVGGSESSDVTFQMDNAPPPAPSMPASEHVKYFPLPTPNANFTRNQKACGVVYEDSDGKSTHELQIPPVEYDGMLQDSTYYMQQTASWWLAGEIFRTFSGVAYVLGVLANEASIYTSHLAKKPRNRVYSA